MTNYDKLLDEVRNLGMDYKWARMFIKKLAEDERDFPTTEAVKEWALNRGFYPGRVEFYGLNEDNYKDFLPDYQYFMLHPLNNHFLKWLDKTTLKYVLNSNGCESTMPEYYVYVENDGSFTYLMDAPAHIEKNADFLMNLLREKGILAMKPNSGTSGGFGFIKLELQGNTLYENNKVIDMERFIEIRNSMRNYVITEYAKQHADLAAIWPKSECTLRVIMVKDPKEDLYAPSTWSCSVSFARFGAEISGGASNMSSGGIGVGFDFETGKFNEFGTRFKEFCADGQWRVDRHPDTQVEWRTLTMPNWPYCRKKIEDLCQHISSLDYLGLDIIITDAGIKLCEINTHPGMDHEHILCGPPLAKKKIRTFFEHKGLFKYDANEFYRAYMNCQE